MKHLALGKVMLAVVLGWSVGIGAAGTASTDTDQYADFGGAKTPEEMEQVWQLISNQYFPERTIVEGDEQQIISLEVPSRASCLMAACSWIKNGSNHAGQAVLRRRE